jgi:hypothetical protein
MAVCNNVTPVHESKTIASPKKATGQDFDSPPNNKGTESPPEKSPSKNILSGADVKKTSQAQAAKRLSQVFDESLADKVIH